MVYDHSLSSSGINPRKDAIRLSTGIFQSNLMRFRVVSGTSRETTSLCPKGNLFSTLTVHSIGEKDIFIRKGFLVVENRLRQVIRQFPACLSFFGIGDASLGDGEYRILFRLRTEFDEFDIIGPFLKILLSLLPSTVLNGRLSSNDECVGGWLFADRANGELLCVETQPASIFDDEDEESDLKPRFIGSVPVSRSAAPEGLSHLYDGHDLWSDALSSCQRDIGACMKLDHHIY